MKKIKDAKKLQLNVETIQTLTGDELTDVVGGIKQGPTQSSAQVICTKIPTCCVKDD
jgi:hypothetical protein